MENNLYKEKEKSRLQIKSTQIRFRTGRANKGTIQVLGRVHFISGEALQEKHLEVKHLLNNFQFLHSELYNTAVQSSTTQLVWELWYSLSSVCSEKKIPLGNTQCGDFPMIKFHSENKFRFFFFSSYL